MKQCVNIIMTEDQRSLTCSGGCDTDVASAHLHGPLKNPGPETEVQLGVALAILYLVSIWYREKKFKLVSTGLYGLMRHPVYSFLILSVWITPTMVRAELSVISLNNIIYFADNGALTFVCHVHCLHPDCCSTL